MTWLTEWWIDLAERLGLPDSFRYSFVARGAVAVLLLAPLLGGLSHLVAARRLAFFGATLGQAALTGLAIGVAAGQALDETYAPILASCLLVGVVTTYVRRHARLPPDTVTGVFVAFTLGLGVCLLAAATPQLNSYQIEAVMFGSLLAITDRDLLLLAVLGACVGLAVALRYNVLLADSLSPPLARAGGAPTTAIEYGFVVVIAVAITISLKVIGALLVEAMVVVPAAAARNVARSTRGYLGWSVAVAAVAGIAGLAISILWRVPTGGAIALALGGCFAITLPIGRLRR